MSDRDYDYERFSALVERTRAELKKQGALPHNPLPPDWDLMPLPRLWPVLNDRKRQRRAAESTFQAVAYVLRTHGIKRLADNWMLPRLAEFSSEQMRDLLAALTRMQPRYPAITDELISAIKDQANGIEQ